MIDIKKTEDIAQIAGAHNKAVIDLLIEKGIFTKEELRQKTIKLTGLSEAEFNRKIENIAKE